jgi:hypothetical protein
VLGLYIRLIIGTAQTEARGDGVADGQPLWCTQLSVTEDRAQFGVDPQKVVLVGAVGFRGVVDDLDRREGSNPESAPPSPGGP